MLTACETQTTLRSHGDDDDDDDDDDDNNNDDRPESKNAKVQKAETLRQTKVRFFFLPLLELTLLFAAVVVVVVVVVFGSCCRPRG